jgi:ABC-type nitrate/sulfonate/bicarbonate transport system permease component
MKKKGKKSKVIALEKKQSYVLMIISVVVGFFIWWQIINRWIDHLYWPSIPSIIHSLVQIRSNILLYIGASIYRTILGYVLGCSLGILIAYAMSLSRVVDAVITPYIEILRPFSYSGSGSAI